MTYYIKLKKMAAADALCERLNDRQGDIQLHAAWGNQFLKTADLASSHLILPPVFPLATDEYHSSVFHLACISSDA